MLEIIAREVWVAPIVKVDEGFPHTENIIFFYQKKWLDSFHLSFFLIKHDTKDSSQVPWNHSPAKKTYQTWSHFMSPTITIFSHKEKVIVAKCYILVWYSMETFFISQGQCTSASYDGWYLSSSEGNAELSSNNFLVAFFLHALSAPRQEDAVTQRAP